MPLGPRYKKRQSEHYTKPNLGPKEKMRKIPPKTITSAYRVNWPVRHHNFLFCISSSEIVSALCRCLKKSGENEMRLVWLGGNPPRVPTVHIATLQQLASKQMRDPFTYKCCKVVGICASLCTICMSHPRTDGIPRREEGMHDSNWICN